MAHSDADLPTAAPTRLSIPRIDRWPLCVRFAELQRGTLVRCGPGVRLAGWPETPRVRLAALAPWLTPNRIAILSTAAWVWGAIRSPDDKIELSASQRQTLDTLADHRVHFRQLRIAPSELTRFGDFAVTTPERTILDMLRLAPKFTQQHRSACRLLILHAALSRTTLLNSLNAAPSAHRGRARTRLHEL